MALQRNIRQNGWMGVVERLVVDVVLLNVATVGALFLRMDFRSAAWSLVYTRSFLGLLENLVFVAVSVLLKTPFALWSYSSLRDVERVAIVVVATKVLTFPLLIGMRADVSWSRGAFVASAVLCFLFMTGVRSTREARTAKS